MKSFCAKFSKTAVDVFDGWAVKSSAAMQDEKCIYKNIEKSSILAKFICL